MKWYKKPVTVISKDHIDGTRLPLCIEWDNGFHYEIDKIIDYRKSAKSMVGGCGQLFVCMIHGQQRRLFLEHVHNHERWFIESTRP